MNNISNINWNKDEFTIENLKNIYPNFIDLQKSKVDKVNDLYFTINNNILIKKNIIYFHSICFKNYLNKKENNLPLLIFLIKEINQDLPYKNLLDKCKNSSVHNTEHIYLLIDRFYKKVNTKYSYLVLLNKLVNNNLKENDNIILEKTYWNIKYLNIKKEFQELVEKNNNKIDKEQIDKEQIDKEQIDKEQIDKEIKKPIQIQNLIKNKVFKYLWISWIWLWSLFFILNDNYQNDTNKIDTSNKDFFKTSNDLSFYSDTNYTLTDWLAKTIYTKNIFDNLDKLLKAIIDLNKSKLNLELNQNNNLGFSNNKELHTFIKNIIYEGIDFKYLNNYDDKILIDLNYWLSELNWNFSIDITILIKDKFSNEKRNFNIYLPINNIYIIEILKIEKNLKKQIQLLLNDSVRSNDIQSRDFDKLKLALDFNFDKNIKTEYNLSKLKFQDIFENPDYIQSKQIWLKLFFEINIDWFLYEIDREIK